MWYTWYWRCFTPCYTTQLYRTWYTTHFTQSVYTPESDTIHHVLHNTIWYIHVVYGIQIIDGMRMILMLISSVCICMYTTLSGTKYYTHHVLHNDAARHCYQPLPDRSSQLGTCEETVASCWRKPRYGKGFWRPCFCRNCRL